MSKTINREYPIFGVDENTGTFLSFRTSIAGTGNGSAIVKIDEDIGDLYTKIKVLEDNGSTIQNVSFTFNATDNCYYGGEGELKPNSIVIFSIDNKEIEVETRLKFGAMNETAVMRTELSSGELIAMHNSYLIVGRPYLAYYDGERFILVGCVVNEGDASEMTVSFAESDEPKIRENISAGNSFKTILGKISKWFKDFGSLAWKSIVGTNDVEDKAITTAKIADNAITNDKIVKMPATTIKGNLSDSEDAVADIEMADLKEALNLKYGDIADTPPVLLLSGGTVTGKTFFNDAVEINGNCTINSTTINKNGAVLIDGTLRVNNSVTVETGIIKTKLTLRDPEMGESSTVGVVLQYNSTDNVLSLLRSSDNSHSRVFVSDPSEDKHAANKEYVDSKVSGITCASIGAQEASVLKTNDSATEVVLEVEDNAEYDYTDVSALTIKGNTNSAHGFITFASSVTEVKYDDTYKFVSAAGDDVTAAVANQVWEFDTLNGRIIWKNWGVPQP